jgi:phosphoglycolate phosphatase-like HAD superfamily hydrolase
MTQRRYAAVFDWDKTLSPHYMQSPIFKDNNVDEAEFWRICHERTVKNTSRFENPCYVEHEYLNVMVEYNREGGFKFLDNDALIEYGKQIQLNPGVEELFHNLTALGIEIVIITSGIGTMLRGVDVVNRYVKRRHIIGAEFNEGEGEYGSLGITSIARSITPYDKVRAIKELDIDPVNMVYVGDGLTDRHAFEYVGGNGGYALGVYNPGVPQQKKDLLEFKTEDIVDEVLEANFSGAAGGWILNRFKWMRRDDIVGY